MVLNSLWSTTSVRVLICPDLWQITVHANTPRGRIKARTGPSAWAVTARKTHPDGWWRATQ